MMLLPLLAAAQEVLTPLQSIPVPSRMMVGKAAPRALELPFFDDFADGALSASRWEQGGGATATFDVRPLAPTVGVLTLDAIDVQGWLYDAASVEVFPADTATSLPVRLDSLSPSDSVVLSFYYMPGGGTGQMWERMGLTPDAQDTLFLDFYKAADSMWHTVWFCGGSEREEGEPRWRYAAVALTDIGYFDSTFRFRFRNFASLESTPKAGKAGNCDYWHIDYLLMDSSRTMAPEPAMRDIAFAAPAPSLLRGYRAMPFRQYVAGDMVTTMEMKITNRYSSELATQYGFSIQDSLGNELYSYDGGYENAPPFATGGYQTAAGHASPQVGYTFPTMTEPTTYEVVHTVRAGSSGDDYGKNDTVRYRQIFSNYYAYDDGTPENGYSLTSTAPSMLLAYRFDLSVEDTLTAIDIFFNSTLDEANADIDFHLMLWTVGTDGKPQEVLYRDEARRRPVPGRFNRYILESPVLVQGGLFVGFEQQGNDFINLGFDRSNNTAGRIYSHTEGDWKQSYLSGSLMIRPYFGIAATVEIDKPQVMAFCPVVYPNPASEWVRVNTEVRCLALYDMFGRKVAESQQASLYVGSQPDGVYLLRSVDKDGQIGRNRLIIRH